MQRVRFRLTVRRMMALVAIVAIALGLGLWVLRLDRTAGEFAREARKHAFLESGLRAQYRLMPPDPDPANLEKSAYRDELALMGRLIQYQMALRKKYEEATRTPWKSVDPDPPPPK